MGARRRIGASVRGTRFVGRIVAGVLVSGATVALTLDIAGPAGADGSGAPHAAAPAGSGSVAPPAPLGVPAPAAVPPTTVAATAVPVAAPSAAPVMSASASGETSDSQPQPAIGAPAGSNPWDGSNAG